jgi:nucleotidyltransferase substrate binding protein (TIGR01987 family)
LQIKELIDETVKIILKHAHPTRIYLYGSRAAGEATETSDIDIAYDDKDFKDFDLIEQDVRQLSTLLKIEVKNLAFTEERFRNRVKDTGRVLYSSDKKLRFEDGLHNYQKAVERFAEVVDRREEFYREGFGDIYLDLVVKRFEFTYEMSWKAIKRYLDFIGMSCINPRSCFQEAYAQKLISEESIWLDMIEQRNLSSHIYDENEIKGILLKIGGYKTAFEQLFAKLKAALE